MPDVTRDTIKIREIRELFWTSKDADVVRDASLVLCVTAGDVFVGGEPSYHERQAACDRLAEAWNTRTREGDAP